LATFNNAFRQSNCRDITILFSIFNRAFIFKIKKNAAFLFPLPKFFAQKTPLPTIYETYKTTQFKTYPMDTQLTPFEGSNIRKIWHEEEWYFSIIDVLKILTDSKDPNQYWKKMKSRDPQMLTGVQIVPLSSGQRKIICSNTEGVFRIAMSVSSPKAEPLKLWLASLGKQAIDEVENPELLTERQAELYRAKGYTEEWIGKRVQTIETRKELTDEWKGRGVKENQEYAILTATIAKGTFGLSPSEHSKLKGLERQNLRDHYLSRLPSG
jgi:DNA-damage-inducible protein D